MDDANAQSLLVRRDLTLSSSSLEGSNPAL